ncbi:hypothetical protein C8F01DRAFT_1026621 [Mycena amicta]|nr:hypothetical protein C8F01DRAFT_1026621 [Mycena amicta]
MKEPKTGTQCESGMCPLHDRDEGGTRGGALMRCSMCKNRFYCSAKCQKGDWKEHKWNCSVLPVDGRPAATVIEINDEFKTEVKRVVAILKEVAAAMDSEDAKVISAPVFATLLEITSKLPESLHYKHAIQDSDKFKYRLPLVTASRLLLIDYLSALDDTGRLEYETFFAELTLPTSYCEMYGPKIAGRPADLSPGEYTMLGQVMPMWVIEKFTPKEDAGEENQAMPWLWLAGLINRVYDA